jgi:hypothetical protein
MASGSRSGALHAPFARAAFMPPLQKIAKFGAPSYEKSANPKQLQASTWFGELIQGRSTGDFYLCRCSIDLFSILKPIPTNAGIRPSH